MLAFETRMRLMQIEAEESSVLIVLCSLVSGKCDLKLIKEDVPQFLVILLFI